MDDKYTVIMGNTLAQVVSEAMNPIRIMLTAVSFYFVHASTCSHLTEYGLLSCRKKGLSAVPEPLGVLQDARQRVISLDLAQNAIEVLHEDALSMFPRLRILNMDDNRLWKITEHAFRAVSELEELSLRKNYLSIQAEGLAASCWAFTPKLKKLDLSENPIGFLPEYFFVALSQLQVLRLESMMNMKFEYKSLSGLKTLRHLSLANNQWEDLPIYLIGDLQEMDSLKQITLEGNAWNCDCKLAWFINWYRSIRWQKEDTRRNYKKSGQTKPICSQPEFLHGQYFSMLNPADLQCEPRLFTRPLGQTVQAYAGSNISFHCDFDVDYKTEPNWYKDHIPVHQSKSLLTTRHRNGTYVQTALNLINVRPGYNNGFYQCAAGNRLGTVLANFTLVIHEEPLLGKADINSLNRLSIAHQIYYHHILNNKWATIGVTVGTIVLILILGAALFYYSCRSRTSGRKMFTQNKKSTIRIIRASQEKGVACDTKQWERAVTAELLPNEYRHGNGTDRKRSIQQLEPDGYIEKTINPTEQDALLAVSNNMYPINTSPVSLKLGAQCTQQSTSKIFRSPMHETSTSVFDDAKRMYSVYSVNDNRLTMSNIYAQNTIEQNFKW